MNHVDTSAKLERIAGDYGTVEFHAKGASPKPYRSSTVPSAHLAGTCITAQGAAPTETQRRKRELIESQQTEPKRENGKRGGSAQWAELVGYSRLTDTYGIKVKIRGISPDTYWLSYSKAATLWYEITGTDFSDVAYYA